MVVLQLQANLKKVQQSKILENNYRSVEQARKFHKNDENGSLASLGKVKESLTN